MRIARDVCSNRAKRSAADPGRLALCPSRRRAVACHTRTSAGRPESDMDLCQFGEDESIACVLANDDLEVDRMAGAIDGPVCIAVGGVESVLRPSKRGVPRGDKIDVAAGAGQDPEFAVSRVGLNSTFPIFIIRRCYILFCRRRSVEGGKSVCLCGDAVRRLLTESKHNFGPGDGCAGLAVHDKGDQSGRQPYA